MELELVLVPIAILLVMYATARSPAAGLTLAAVTVGLVAGAREQNLLMAVAAAAGSGLLVGLAVRGRASASRAILLGTAPAALAVIAGLPARAVREERWEEMLRLGLGDAVPPESREAFLELALSLLPAGAALYGALIVLVSYAVATRLFPRAGLPVRAMGRLADLRLPFGVVWVFAASLLACVIGHSLGPRWLLHAGLNLIVLEGAAFFMGGLAVGRHALAARQVPGLVQWILGVSLLMMPLPLIVSGVGLLDLWLDFRRLLTPPAENG